MRKLTVSLGAILVLGLVVSCGAPSTPPSVAEEVVEEVVVEESAQEEAVVEAGGELLPATMARDEAVEVLIREVIEPDSNRDVLVAYGPQAMLRDGDLIEPAETTIAPFFGSSVQISRDTWFFWIDDEPSTHFVHPTRFVLIDATRPDARIGDGIEISEQGWWPEINGEAYYDDSVGRLVSPDVVFGDPQVEPQANTLPAGWTHSPAGRVPGLGAPIWSTSLEPGISARVLPWIPQQQRCAILISQRADVEMIGDIRDMTTSLDDPTSSADLVRANILTQVGATQNDVSRLITRANSSGCQAVYFHITAHGGVNSIGLADGYINAQQFARLLAGLDAQYVYVTIESCYSGSLADEILAAVRGIVATSASDRRTSGYWVSADGTTGYSFFPRDLTTAWVSAAADAGDDDTQVSLPEAFLHVQAHGRARTRAADPTINPRYIVRSWSWWVDRQWPAPNYYEFDYEVTNVLSRDVTKFKVCFDAGTVADDIIETEGSEWQYTGGALHEEGTGVMTIPDGWAWSFPASEQNCVVFNTSGSHYRPIAVGETRTFKFMSGKDAGQATATVGRWDGSTHVEDPQIDVVGPNP